MSRRNMRDRAPPKAIVSDSVRLGLESMVEDYGPAIRCMLTMEADKAVIDGLLDCMGVNKLTAEMLMANYFSIPMLSAYCRDRIAKSDKGNAATLAGRIAREWAKPSFTPLPKGTKRKAPEAPAKDPAAAKAAAMADLMAKRAKQSAPAAEAAPSAGASATNPHVALFVGQPSATNPHMAFAKQH